MEPLRIQADASPQHDRARLVPFLFAFATLPAGRGSYFAAFRSDIIADYEDWMDRRLNYFRPSCATFLPNATGIELLDSSRCGLQLPSSHCT